MGLVAGAASADTLEQAADGIYEMFTASPPLVLPVTLLGSGPATVTDSQVNVAGIWLGSLHTEVLTIDDEETRGDSVSYNAEGACDLVCLVASRTVCSLRRQPMPDRLPVSS